MYQKILNFIKYNNAFTIIFVICFFGFGITYAASPEVRDSVYSSKETVVSIDNTLIVSTDLDNFNFNLRISSITEDAKNYYVAYSYQTLAIENGFWQNKEMEKTLTISKEALDGKDLGLYMAKELGENINYELSYLKRVQKLEREKGESQKVVATEYSGLIGKLLNPKEEVVEGYNPVIPEPAPVVESNPASVIVSTPYYEPSNKSAPISTPTPPPTSSAPPRTEPAQESTSTPTSTPATLPAPEQMIDEKKVQEVVNELQSGASSTPTTEAAPDSTSSPQATP